MTYLPNRRLMFAALGLALLILGILVGCANDPVVEIPTATPAPPTPTPLPRGGNLTLGLASEVTDLRPWQPRSRAEEQAITLLYSGLTHLDATLTPKPDLAERWDTSADGRLITFTLRTNLAWHDGAPLDADDVVYTLDTLREISPTTALLSDLRSRIADVTAITTNTVAISLTEAYAPMLADLAVPILPRHLFDGTAIAEQNFLDNPIGSGPFKYEARQPGESITFAANPLYYRGPPLLDRVTLVVEPNAAAATEALASGELLAAELPPNPTEPITASVPALQTGAYAENGSYFLAFNTREGRPFADPQVRNALATAIDLPALVRDATNGTGMVLANGAAPGSWADTTAPVTATADIAAARAMLENAGYRLADGGEVRQRDGVPLQGTIIVRNDDQPRIRAARSIAQAARTVGISLTVQLADFATEVQPKYLPPYDFDMLMGSWSGGVGDPAFGDYIFYDPDDYLLFHSSQINQGSADTRAVLNFVGFNDSAYETQAVAARQLYDTSQRRAAIQQAQARINALKPYLYLWTGQTVTAFAPALATLDGPIDRSTPLYLWNIERWYIQPQ